MNANELIYVYCMSESPPAIDQLTEFDGLKSLVVEGFYLVIKFVPESEFSEINLKRNLSNLKWLDDNAREHISVIIRVSENCTVIPFKFGTVYHSTDSIKDFVRDYSTSLIENFNKIRGKEEWSVKIYYNRTVLSRQIDELSEEAAALEKQIIASSPGKAFLLKRKKTDLIETEMDRLCKKYGQAYFDEFKSSSVDSTLENLRKKDGNTGFFIETTGPWPAFSFVSIKVK